MIRAAVVAASDLSSELGGTFIPTQDEEALATLRLVILNMDPPQHNRYRRLVSRGFTPRMIAKLSAEIERRAAVVVDEVCERGEAEFVEDIAARATDGRLGPIVVRNGIREPIVEADKVKGSRTMVGVTRPTRTRE